MALRHAQSVRRLIDGLHNSTGREFNMSSDLLNTIAIEAFADLSLWNTRHGAYWIGQFVAGVKSLYLNDGISAEEMDWWLR
jgi:hypothetical protein